jgi:hypothetical protein
MATFELNLGDMMNFRRMKQKSPKLFARASGNVLNSSAFGTRKLAIRNLKKNQIIRNAKFVSSSVRVNKARLSGPVAQMEAQTGSVERERFSGWREQEGGQQTKREHYAKETARREDRKKRILSVARLKAAGRFPKPTDFPTKGGPMARAAKMVHILSRSGFTKPFLIFGLEKKTRGRKPPPGLYRLGPGKYPNRRLTLLQRFKKPRRTRKKPWLAPATKEYIDRVDLRTVWGRAVARELKKIGVRI